MDAEVPALVIDCGESTTKVGFAGDDAPKSFFPSIVGYSRTCGALEGGSKNFLIDRLRIAVTIELQLILIRYSIGSAMMRSPKGKSCGFDEPLKTAE